MSRFILHTKTGKREYLKYLAAGTACLILAVVAVYMIHSIGTAKAKSRELVLIYTGEEFVQYLLDTESEEYNLNGRYQLENDLDLSWLEYSIGTNVEPFTGKLDGNGHMISGLGRPLFGVMEHAEIENLFFSEAEILSPFTYSDGEHYVDGYGALAAYAIDTRISNCGMNGAIYTASPSEAEYLLEKASPSEIEERKEPGLEESTATSDTQKEIGPGLTEDGEHGKTEGDTIVEVGPGYETESGENMELESSAVEESCTDGEKGPAEETGVPEESNNEETGSAGGAAGNTEGTAGNESTNNADVETSDETNNNETSGSGENETESGSTEGVSDNEESDSSGEENMTGEKTEASENFDNMEPEQAEAAQSSSEPDRISSGTATTNISETVGYQVINRRKLMLKLPVMVDADTESIQPASPSDATLSDDQDLAESDAPFNSGGQNPQINEDSKVFDEPEESIEYIGNPDGHIYILVTAERVTVGGLIAETSGETLISNSFTLATISSALGNIETYTGGFIGITGQGTRIENSYASGLTDSDDVTGGFAGIHNGFIQNSYSSMIIGESGNIRAAFGASGDGQISNCMYDNQMACTDDVMTFAEETSAEFGLKGQSTSNMTGIDAEIPGTWYLTEHGYPQIEYFATSNQEGIASASKVSAIALSLPENRSLADAVNDGDIILPAEIDGQIISWEADGSIRINENNQILVESGF